MTGRFLSPLIEPDVRISRIRLSDWLHRMAHGRLSPAGVLRGMGFRLCLRPTTELSLKDPDLSGVCRLTPITRSSLSSKAYQKSGTFPPPELPGFSGTMSLSDSRRSRRPVAAFEAATLAATGLPRCPDHLPNVPCPLPRWTERVLVSILPRCAWPSPYFRRVGAHDIHFRGLLRLHSRYGPPGCSTAQGGLRHEASTRPVTQQCRSSATRPIDSYLGGFFLHW